MKSKFIPVNFIIYNFRIILVVLLYSCNSPNQKIVNDGYGDYLFVPAGKFLMGDNFNDSWLDSNGFSQEKPVHPVNLKAYYIGKYEVTNEEFKKFIDDGGYINPDYWTAEEWEKASSELEKDIRNNPYGNVIKNSYGRQPEFWNDSTYNGGGIPGNENFPVIGVNLHEANAYCKWLSEKTGATYRLPTEAEWEKAARGTDQRRFPWGDYIDRCYANYRSGDPYETNLLVTGGLTPVGYYNGSTYKYPDSKQIFITRNNASPYGAYDMAGNVWEWVSDRWDSHYYSVSPIDNPTGPLPSDSIGVSPDAKFGDYIASIRGGFWMDSQGIMNMNSLRSAYRGMVFSGPHRRHSHIGFRCVREVH
jgi:formylglycine-generating enzyme required for sulfatase activity